MSYPFYGFWSKTSFESEHKEKYLYLKYFIGSLKIFVCSAGVGRTGVFISLSIVLERMQYEGVVDVFQTVSELSLVSWHNTEL